MSVFNISLNSNNELDQNLFDFLKNNKSINLDLIDQLQEFYIKVTLGAEELNIPFSYILINTNKKLNGIPYINFEVECSSKALGLCNNSKYCYSLRDQHLFKSNNYKIILNVYFVEELQNNKELFNKVIEFLTPYKLIRYNCNNDLNNKDNILFLNKIAGALKNSIIAGYTNRFDLIKDYKELQGLKLNSNLIFNGSNYMLDNNYYVTTNLKLYCSSNNICLGSCKNCLKCYCRSNKKIYCLLHGALSNIDSAFNTPENRAFIVEFFNTNFNYLNLKDSDLTVNKGLLSSLNKYFKNHELYFDYKFKNYKELTTYIRALSGGV